MSAAMFLTAEQIRELTERTHRRAQVEMLRALGIEHKVRPDGSIVVLRTHVEKVLGGDGKAAPAKEWEPDWSSM